MVKIKIVWIDWEDDDDPDVSWLNCTPEDHYGEDGSNWAHVSDEEKAQVIKRYGSVWAACKVYAEEDQQRLGAFYKGEWWMTGCVAHATVSYPWKSGDGRRLEEFTSGGLWGIESDASDEYHKEIEKEQLADLKDHLKQFGIDTSDFYIIYMRNKDG